MDRDTTTWTKMASHLTNVWVETGTQMWKSWFDLMDYSAPTDDTATESDPVKSATQQFANNQELFVRFIKLSFEAWKEVFPKAEAGEDWQQVLKKYTQQMRTQLDGFSAETLKTSQDTAQLWQLYIKEMQKFSQLWTATLGVSMKPMGRGGNGSPEPWLELNNLYWNLLYEETFGSLMQSPVLGPSREFHGKVLRAFDAWANVYRESIDYQIVLADIQIRSFEELMQELISLAEKGKKVDDWREVQRLWSSTADKVFEKEFCKEDNLKIRGNFLNALNTYRLHQQELMELWLKTMNMPVRSEVDEVHKNIYELRKEIKTLTRKLANPEAGVWEAQPLPSAVGEDREIIGELRQEIETLRQKLANVEAIGQETQQLRQEIQALKQAQSKWPILKYLEAAGSSISATPFSIHPKPEAPVSRIRTLRIHSGWVIDKIQVQYEHLEASPPTLYDSSACGGRGGDLRQFSLNVGDYLTSVSGEWGAQAPGYPREEIVSLQFQTKTGQKSQVFGSGNPRKQVESFSFIAPDGYEIVGFFGAYGGHQNALVRLGIYIHPVYQDSRSLPN